MPVLPALVLLAITVYCKQPGCQSLKAIVAPADNCLTGSSPPFASEQAGEEAAAALLLHQHFFQREIGGATLLLQKTELPLTPFIQEMLHPKTAEDTLQINLQEALQ